MTHPPSTRWKGAAPALGLAVTLALLGASPSALATYSNAVIGDRVWLDNNGNGIQDEGEPGLDTVKVELYKNWSTSCGDGQESHRATAHTDADGSYRFSGLAAGNYCVKFIAPSICNGGPAIFTQKNAGDAPGRDSDADPETGWTDPITLGVGESNLDIDAGFYCPAAVGDFVWEDTIRNNVQDDGEPGIAGVEVELYFCEDDAFVARTTTDANGKYMFERLAPGSYWLQFPRPAADGSVTIGGEQYHYVLTQQCGDCTRDSDARPETGQTRCFDLASGETNPNLDAGLFKKEPPPQQKGAIGNFVWHDLNADGIQGPNEPGIAGVQVDLHVCKGASIATTVTGSEGEYLFEGLEAGRYQVKFTRPGGFEFGSPQFVGDPRFDSNADPDTGVTPCFNLAEGEVNLTIDAGFYKSAALGDFVWNDLNQNGIQDMGEPGIRGVKVNLWTCDGDFLDDTMTDRNGIYSFTGLKPGSYQVSFEAPDGFVFSPQFQGNDPAKDSNANPMTGFTPCVTLISGQTDNTIDAGLYKKEVPVTNPGTGSRGFWTNHPNAWPVEEITIGGVTYTKHQAIAEIRTPPRGDVTRILFPQLVAAKLNVLIGNDPSCIADTIAAADEWMAKYGPVGSNVRGNSFAWRIGEPLYKKLDDYNNGKLCAPKR